jgi:hypothetical protein
MERIGVESSMIRSIGFEPTETDSAGDDPTGIVGTLEVEFNNGAIYQYFGVPMNLYELLMASDSKGKFLNANVKPVFEYSRADSGW